MSSSWRNVPVMVMALVVGSLSLAYAQFGGSRAGVEEGRSSAAVAREPARYNPDVAEAFVSIDGRAELQVEPTEIRIVLALTSEAPTATECQQAIASKLKLLTTAWTKTGIAKENIVEDFIAVLPLYEWNVESREGVEMAVENRSGYRMQTNVHLAVDSQQQAKAALDDAFAQNVTDIIAFDYWSRELDEAKVKARAEALAAAKAKSDTLLALFDERPKVINVQEETTVHYPESMYASFTNTVDQAFSLPFRKELPVIRAHRPQNTYYQGIAPQADRQSPELPMKPKISVISTVRVYYRSPAAPDRPSNGGR